VENILTLEPISFEVLKVNKNEGPANNSDQILKKVGMAAWWNTHQGVINARVEPHFRCKPHKGKNMPFSRVLFTLSLVLTTAFSVVMSPNAVAQEATVFAAPGEVELLAPLTVRAGERVQLTVVALEADGSPMAGLKGKASATLGKCDGSGWLYAGDGKYNFWYTAPAAETVTNVTVSWKGKNSKRVPFALQQRIDVLPQVGSSIAVSVSPDSVMLGQSSDASVTFSLVGAAHLNLSEDDLLIVSSSGTITNVTHMGEGQFVARFTPPAVKYPHLALVTVALKSNPDVTFGHVVIPMVGKVPYPITATPNSTVMLTVDGRTFGPIKADSTGKVSVPIEVAPGQDRATKTIVADGKKLEESVDLRIPETRRVALFPAAAGVGADGTSRVALRVLVVQKNGDPDEQANLKLNLGDNPGELSATTHAGGGIYETYYSAPTGTPAGQVTVSASLGGSTIQNGDFQFQVVGELPASMTLTGEPRMVTDNTAQLRLFMELRSQKGVGVEGQSLALYPAGASLSGDVSDLRSGTYQASFKPTGGNVEIMATVRAPSAGNGVHHLSVMPMSPRVNNDGTSTDLLLIVATDAQGYPVANVSVDLSVEGDGTVDRTAVTDANGLASVLYKSGRSAGIVEIHATTAGVSTSAAVVQAASGEFGPMAGGGTVAAVTIAERWAGLTGVLSVPREGAESAAVAAVSMPDRVVPAAKIVLEVQPESANVGDKIVVVARVLDGEGVGLSGHDLNGSLGGDTNALSDWTDNGDGSYSANFVVSADATGTQTITVASGAVTGAAHLVVEGVPGAVVISTTKKPRKKSANTGEHRVSVGLVSSLLSYRQSPYTSTGPILPNTVEFGKSGDSSAAHPMGVVLAARGVLTGPVYYDASFEAQGYAISSAEFGDTLVYDTTTSGHAHVGVSQQLTVGGVDISAGIRGGLSVEDYLLWSLLVDETSGAQSIEYSTIMPFGGSVALDLGVQLSGWSLGASASQAYAYFTNRHVNAFGLNASVDLSDALFLNLGADVKTRGIELVGTETGTVFGDIQDQTTSLEVGVGMKF
jgi:hypothetical protein